MKKLVRFTVIGLISAAIGAMVFAMIGAGLSTLGVVSSSVVSIFIGIGGTLGAVAFILGLILLALAYWELAKKVASAARRKGRDYESWFWIAIFFLVPAAIIVAIMRNESEQRVLVGYTQPTPTPSLAVGETKTCPFCGEQILAVAKKCKHCGEFLESQS